MSASGLRITLSALLTVGIHGGLLAGYLYYRDIDAKKPIATPTSNEETAARALLCHDLRCPRLESKKRRRDIEPAPIEVPDVLDAALIPALGAVEQDPTQLPEIETYERPEIHEEAVNLEKPPEEIQNIHKDTEAKPELKDPKNKETLKDLLSKEPLDPRARAKDLSRLTGVKDGDVTGTGSEARAGSIYSAQVAKAIYQVFKRPVFIDEATLKKLVVKVHISRLTFDGRVEEFRVVSRSGNPSYDDAAIAAIKQFVPKEGGTKNLPSPDPETLRFINTKGLTITLDGKRAR